MNKLEVLIMNDGSTDGTKEICERYCNEYPDVFFLINKENGGWGSNINFAIKIAQGKYFRILDADDWFEMEELQKFVMVLSDINESLVISRYTKYSGKRIKQESSALRKYMDGECRCLNQLQDKVTFGIWEVTFFTSLVNEYHIDLPENALYMDTLFIMQLLPYVHRVYFTDLYVYNYRSNRAGQSTSIEGLKKHYKEMLLAFDKQLAFYERMKDGNNNLQLLYRLASTYSGVILGWVQISGDKEIHAGEWIKEYDEKIKRDLPELYLCAETRKIVKTVRLTNYRFYFLIKRAFNIYHIFF